MKLKNISCLIFTIATFAALQSFAQPYSSKPIRVIVAIAAGSPTDVVMRTAARELQNSLGQPLTIENRPGGDMVIGSEACVRAAPDGYTFCVVSNTAVSINPHIFSRLPYDPATDFTPVTPLWFLIQGMIGTASLPANSVKEVQALATARPGSLNMGTLGAGGADFHRRWLNEHWNTNIVGIPYKGANLVMNALVAGEIHLGLIALGSLGGQLKAGKVKLFAVGSSRRLRQLPDMPTYAEVGLEGFPRTWWGLFAPAGVAEAVVTKINSTVVQVFHKPQFAAYLESQFLEPAVTTPEEFAAFLKKDRETAGLMVRRFDIPRQ